MGFFKRIFGGKDAQPQPEEPAGRGGPPRGIAAQLEAARRAAQVEVAEDAAKRAAEAERLSAPGPLPATNVTYSSAAPPLDARFSREREHFVVECPGPGGDQERFRFPFDCLALIAAGKGKLRIDLHVPVPVHVGQGRLALRSFLGQITDADEAAQRWAQLARRNFLVAPKCPYCFQPGLEAEPARSGVPHPEDEGRPRTTAVCQACRSQFDYDYADGKFVLVESAR